MMILLKPCVNQVKDNGTSRVIDVTSGGREGSAPYLLQIAWLNIPLQLIEFPFLLVRVSLNACASRFLNASFVPVLGTLLINISVIGSRILK